MMQQSKFKGVSQSVWCMIIWEWFGNTLETQRTQEKHTTTSMWFDVISQSFPSLGIPRGWWPLPSQSTLIFASSLKGSKCHENDTMDNPMKMDNQEMTTYKQNKSITRVYIHKFIFICLASRTSFDVEMPQPALRNIRHILQPPADGYQRELPGSGGICPGFTESYMKWHSK